MRPKPNRGRPLENRDRPTRWRLLRSDTDPIADSAPRSIPVRAIAWVAVCVGRFSRIPEAAHNSGPLRWSERWPEVARAQALADATESRPRLPRHLLGRR